jgi:hypothetical protein
MKKLCLGAMAAALFGASAFAVDYCPPQEKWMDVVETVQVQVPVTEYIDEPCEVQVTRMETDMQEVACTVPEWTYETKQIYEMVPVITCEEYTVDAYRTEMRTETRMRKVKRYIYEEQEKVITKRVCENVCDPVTGQMTNVYRDECETIMVPVRRKVIVEEPYECKVPVKVRVPVTKTRKIKTMVQQVREVRVPKCVQVPSTKLVKVTRPVVETQTVMRKRAVRMTKTVEKQVTRRVRVPVEPCPAPFCF